jgi:putative flippase GtrA
MDASPLPAERRNVAWFVAVGCAAAAVHWLVVVALVSQWQWRPLVANVVGWLVAFGVSFAGHFRLTFRGHVAPPGVSAARFFAVSAAGFAVNECAYALLLRGRAQHYGALLALVLATVAVFTYLLARHWAFPRNRGR